MNKKMLNLLTAYSAFTGSCMNNVYLPSIISNNIKFEKKTRIKGKSAEEMGTKGNKKISRSKRKRMKKKRKKQNENRRNKTSYI